MGILVTGASGWIGSAVVAELIGDNRDVVGFARSERSARAIEEAGAAVVRGDLHDLDTLRKAAASSDGVVHLAFDHDVAFGGDFASAGATDRRAVEVMGAALAGSDRPFVHAGGVIGLALGRVATERDGLVASDATRAFPASVRSATALLVLSLRGVGVRASVVRFAPTVHGPGDAGFIATLVGIARTTGVSGYVGDGTNRWPAVHRDDAARLVCLALDAAPAGSVLHAVGEEGVSFVQIAEAIGHGLGVPTASIDPGEARSHFSFLAPLVGIDSPVSAELTRELLGWTPVGPTLLEDLAERHYFDGGPGPTVTVTG